MLSKNSPPNSFNKLEGDIAVFRAKLKMEELRRRGRSYGELHPNDAQLRAALEFAIESPAGVSKEHAALDQAIRETIAAAPLDPSTRVRADFLEFQKRFVAEITARASRLARERLDYIRKIDTAEKQQEELKKCAEDWAHWFKYYGWTVDPRTTALYAVPFELFDFQVETLKWIDNLIYVRRSNGLIDKSRDMGVTWIVSCYFIWRWLFSTKTKQFHALIGSYKEEEIDKEGDPGSIFEKLRIQIRLLPSWMLPPGFSEKSDMNQRRIVNRATGSSLIGKTLNSQFGRSGRYTVTWLDEFAFAEEDVTADTACSSSTNTRLYTSTPQGKLNRFAEIALGGKIPKLSLHWTRHPLKDKRWYDGKCLEMSAEQIAQELDINYDASQPGKVYRNYDEKYHVITWSEFAENFPIAKVRDSESGGYRYRIPHNWYLGRALDWGSSEEHPCVVLWFARAREGSRTKSGIDISGSVFIYREWVAPVNPTPGQVAREIKRLEAVEREGERIAESKMSHEAKSERATFGVEHQLDFEAWDTDLNAGIAQVRDYLEPAFLHEAHPFRREEAGKPRIMGRPRLYLIVDDNQGNCYYDVTLNRWAVTLPKDSAGLRRLRSEFPIYHYPQQEPGKATRRQKPEKKFDDAMDVLRCMAASFFPPIAPLSTHEKIEAALPPQLRRENILKESPEDMARSWIAKQSFIRERNLEKEVSRKSPISFRDSLYERARN